MINSIGTFANSVYHSISRVKLDIPSNIMKKATMVAVPALLLFGTQFTQFADAGPAAYLSCLAGCAAMGPFAPACWSACLAALALPTP